MTTTRSVLARFSAVLFAVITLAGCAATVDQKIGLEYMRIDQSFGTHSGSITLTRSESKPPVANEKGEWILGSLNNAHGVHQANLLTDSIIGAWVSDALLQELKNAGFTARYEATLPDGVEHGVMLTDISVFLNINKGVVSDDTRHELKFNAQVYIKGNRVKTFTVASRDNRTFPFNVSKEEKERIMLQSLQDAMRQIVPEIISLIEKK